MKRSFTILAAGLALALTLGAAPAFAKPDCGENTGQKATGKPIPIGGVCLLLFIVERILIGAPPDPLSQNAEAPFD